MSDNHIHTWVLPDKATNGKYLGQCECGLTKIFDPSKTIIQLNNPNYPKRTRSVFAAPSPRQIT